MKRRSSRATEATPSGTVYGYCRISLDRSESVSIEAQEAAIQGAHGHSPRLQGLPLMILRDKGVSGAKPLFSRPEGRRLEQLLQPGDHLIVSKVDRAFRSLLDGATMIDRFQRRGIGVHCLDVNIDTTTPVVRAMLHLMMVFAELERSRISERRRDASLYRRQQGECMHSANVPPHGWRVTGQGRRRKYVADQADRKRCDALRTLHDQGLGLRLIEEHAAARGMLNRWGRPWVKTTIRRAIRASRAGYPTTSERFQQWDIQIPARTRQRLAKSQRRRRRQ